MRSSQYAAKTRMSRHLPFRLPVETAEVLEAAPAVMVAQTAEELQELAVRDAKDGWHEVAFEVPGKGRVVEARVCRTKNGIAANYLDPYMRRRDPDCLVIGDKLPTDKPRYKERFGEEFGGVRKATLEWLKGQRLVVFPFFAGHPSEGTAALVMVPENSGFFALGLALLQGILRREEIPKDFFPRAIIYVAPTFRHTHFGGKQVVVHNRRERLHELFSYNLYPGPSAKKGVYGVLLNIGEREKWVTLHCSTVQVITPYDNRLVIAHEGASGGGKSEMLEHITRQADGSLLIGRNVVTGDTRILTLPRGCAFRPVTDDMALCHPSLEKGNGKLTLMDAEQAWFVRVNHINKYGVDPHLEGLTSRPAKPLVFLSIDAHPGSTALIWEHVEDAPGKPCPNPRVILPREIVPEVITGPVDVDVRSFGIRTPPCTAKRPTYGIVGLFHLLPPALAWLWRLVAPRGHGNPSIVQTEGMASEGVGSYWPFATGRMVDHANLLLRQILATPKVRYVLCPNQHIGAWEVGFMPQWIMREYLARRGGARFAPNALSPARCPLLGYTPSKIVIEGSTLNRWFLEVREQPEVGTSGYDRGAAILEEFFHRELRQHLVRDLLPKGRKIIECCLSGGAAADYEGLLDMPTFEQEE